MLKIYKFSEEEINKCEKFAEAFNGNFYASRNQNDSAKIKIDNIVGKLGEIATYNLIKDKFQNLTEPDFEIYSAKEKSWQADLVDGEIKIHVKSQNCEQGEKFGISWIFQMSDKEIFGSDRKNQFIALVSVDLEEKEALLRSLIDLEFLHTKKLFSKPKSKKLQENKKAVYLRELERYMDEMWNGLNE